MDDDAVDLCSPRSAPSSKRRRVDAQECDLTVEGTEGGSGLDGGSSGAGPSGSGTPPSRRRASGGSGREPLRRIEGLGPVAPSTAGPSPRQQQRQRSPEEQAAEDFEMAKRLQEEEDQRAALEETRLQNRFRQLEAEEAAAEAAEAAAAAERGWGGRFLANLLGLGSSAGQQGSGGVALEAGGVAFGQASASRQGQRSQRSRRGPAAEAAFADSVLGHLMPPPFMVGGFGGFGGFGSDVRSQMMMGLSRGLPHDLLLSGRDFTEADYEQLLALDQGNKKKVAAHDRVHQLSTVHVPLAGRGADAEAGSSSGSGSGSGSGSSPRLEACSICLEDARAGDRFRVLPCRHAFHCHCIDRWLTQERNSCPVCQREV